MRRSLGYVPQDGGLLPHWSVARNVALVPWLLGRADAGDAAAAALELVGLPPPQFAARWPHQLSGGQRQRVAFARALAAGARTLLLDEPFGALDAITRSDLQAMFLDLRRASGLTTLLVTHDLHEAGAARRSHRRAAPGTPGPGRSSRRAGRAAGDAVRRRAARARAVRPGARVSRGRRRRRAACAGWSWLACGGAGAGADAAGGAAGRPVVVGTKPFGESYLLGELFAQILEARGIPATRRFGLGGTEIVFPALRQGAIDVFPEYTGSGLLVILKAPLERDPAAVFDTVSREFARQFDVRWLPPLGFENTYAMSVRTELAERLGLRTLSDFARVSGDMRAGFTADFIGLPDGLPGLRAAYGLAPKSVSALAVGREVPGAGRRRGGHHRRLFDRRPARSLSAHRARGRSPVLPALRRGRAGARRPGPRAARGDRRADAN